MKFKGLIAAPLVALLVTALSAAPPDLPAGWTHAGSATDCRTTVDAVAGAPAPKAFVIRCPESRDFAGIAQLISARDYAGRRVRLAAQVQGEAMTGWGGLWLRADAGTTMSRAFDNMQTRPLTGTFGWRDAAVVLQIPADVDTLAFGFLIEGGGVMRATGFRLEVVPDTVPVTLGPRDSRPERPQNLTPQ